MAKLLPCISTVCISRRNLGHRQVTSRFLDFFQERQHVIVPSSSLLAPPETGLLFTNAGMNQFMRVLSGSEPAWVGRATSLQDCIRVGGKHNDLDEVGHDGHHHTFFQMLGSWSFGDYFKEEACLFALELLTSGYGLKKDQLKVTYFAGDSGLSVEADTETKHVWLNLGILEKNIMMRGLKDNFWEMGQTGPCGPCTEVHIVSGGELREIWNIVFIQYNRLPNGSLCALKTPYVDTGLGLERLCAILQGKTSNYDTDLFAPLIQQLEKNSGLLYHGSFDDTQDIAFRLVADHCRMVTKAVAQGILPDHRNAGNKLRRVLRRAVHASQFRLGLKPGQLAELSEIAGDILDVSGISEVKAVINDEEKRYLAMLRKADSVFAAEHQIVATQTLNSAASGAATLSVMRRRSPYLLVFLSLFSVCWIALTYHLLRAPDSNAVGDVQLTPYYRHDIEGKLESFELELRDQKTETQKLFHGIQPFRDGHRQSIGLRTDVTLLLGNAETRSAEKRVIPVLLFACNRVTVRKPIEQLLALRPSAERFPIIVSADCNHQFTINTIRSYGQRVQLIQQPNQTEFRLAPKQKKFRGYYAIARHYGWALNKIFVDLNYNAAIIVEDDLEVAPDFFSYFESLLPILEADPTLYCVSAWNDNGKKGLIDFNNASLLHRSDFFPGLGWMLTRQLWTEELMNKWPKAFWDDWIREPAQRRNRACIRPEVSRTKTFGKQIDWNGFSEHFEDFRRKSQAESLSSMNKKVNLDFHSKALKAASVPSTGHSKIYQNVYEMSSTIVYCAEVGSDCWVVALGDTCFYPEGGGQVADIGTITTKDDQEYRVRNVAKIGDHILHIIEGARCGPQIGSEVILRVDRTHREQCTWHHSACHLLNAAIKHQLGQNVQQHSSAVCDRHFRLDVIARSPVDVFHIEEFINSAIAANLSVQTEERGRDEALSDPRIIRLPGEVYPERIRLVRCGDVSIEACCGTHVSRTGEIPKVVILSSRSLGIHIKSVTATAAASDIAIENAELISTKIIALQSTVEQLTPE
ncbi:alanine--tRNA ligase, partial [Tropilaelaps mercedesae]